jgi:hypothetical protein
MLLLNLRIIKSKKTVGNKDFRVNNKIGVYTVLMELKPMHDIVHPNKHMIIRIFKCFY